MTRYRRAFVWCENASGNRAKYHVDRSAPTVRRAFIFAAELTAIRLAFEARKTMTDKDRSAGNK